MNRPYQTLLVFAGLLVLILIFWSPALMPGSALYLRDISIEIIPYRSFYARSHGFALWNPYAFFGMPFAANPQLGAFYPLNLIFLIQPLSKALTLYIIVHYLLTACFSYLLFRELEFSPESSALAAAAFLFSGIFSSFSNLVVLLSVASWLPLSGWLMVRAVKKRWLCNILGLSVVFALQNLAGDPQIMADNALICAALGLAALWRSGPEKRRHLRLFGGLAMALGLAALITSPQNFLTLEMIPLSNRAAGYSWQEFTLWSLIPGNLWTLFFPNNFLPPQNLYWPAGFWLLPSFLLSIYPGISVLLLAGFCFRQSRRQSLLWLLMFGLGIFLALGAYNPLFRVLYQLPLVRLFRIPEKFFLISGFSAVMLCALGFESLVRNPLKLGARVLPAVLIAAGIAALAASLYLHSRGLAAVAPLKVKQLLILSSMLKSAAVLLAAGGWVLGRNAFAKAAWFAPVAAGIVILDLAGAHFRLNPVTSSSFYSATPEAVSRLDQRRGGSVLPLRIASVHQDRDRLLAKSTSAAQFYLTLRDWVDPFWGIYYQLDDVLAKGSFYMNEIVLFQEILKASSAPERIYARCAVKYIYSPERGVVELPDALSRAMVFYQAEYEPDRRRQVELWESPEFPAGQKVLLEKASAATAGSPGLAAEPAQVVSYSNQKVVVKFNAAADGWLVLFDSYYPGWRAAVDGKEAPIRRANVFFRAVAAPAGEHTVEFRYRPGSFVRGLITAAAGVLGWLALAVLAQGKWKKRKQTGAGSSFSWY